MRITAYPTRAAVFAMAAGLPVSMLLALLAPSLWAVGAAWLAGVTGMMGLDWIRAVRPDRMSAKLSHPITLEVGETSPALLSWSHDRPESHMVSLSATDELVVNGPVSVGAQTVTLHLTARRRGESRVLRLWQRWTGPLGLMWLQRVDELDTDLPVIVDTSRLTEEALNLFNRHADFGQTLQRLRGEGTEFDALTEYVRGMDSRTIDWKHSARHGELLAREYETEKNNHIVFAIDSGYLMTEESEDEAGLTLTKLDRSLSAAMLMAFVSLRLGDKAGLYAFDARPYLYVPPLTGPTGFAQLQRQSANITYSETETNYTLGLATLSQRLKRRTLIIVFSDFVDTTQAELMIENVARLMKRHVVVFVTFRDSGLRDLTDASPTGAEDLARAVVAESLRKEREIVLAKLERLGVNVINTDPGRLNADLINTYVALKAANAI